MPRTAPKPLTPTKKMSASLRPRSRLPFSCLRSRWMKCLPTFWGSQCNVTVPLWSQPGQQSPFAQPHKDLYPGRGSAQRTSRGQAGRSQRSVGSSHGSPWGTVSPPRRAARIQHLGHLLSEVPDLDPVLRAGDRIFKGHVPRENKGGEEASGSLTSGPAKA